MNFENKVIIKGNLGSNKNGEIYLVDIAKMDLIKDSTKVIDGHFNFTYKSTSSFLPFEARLCMWDEIKGKGIKYLRPIGFANTKNYTESTFYVDRGVTTIDGKTNSNLFGPYDIQGSKQNIPYYKHLTLGGNSKNPDESRKIISDDLSLIKRYPYSSYLINLLYINRQRYTNDELKLLINGFSDEGKPFSSYQKLLSWIAYKQKSETFLPDIALKNEKGDKEHVSDSTAKINMLVFWASWCGPCRKEIPDLKEIYQKYHNKGLSITSISLDDNEKNWQNALTVEKMPWRQLLTNDSAKNIFDLEYNISGIPIIVLIDRKGKLIQRFMGAMPKENYYKALSVLDKS
ncbi:MAG: TlpA disulfide reductase family protein [Mucilaginibacter sp.]